MLQVRLLDLFIFYFKKTENELQYNMAQCFSQNDSEASCGGDEGLLVLFFFFDRIHYPTSNRLFLISQF